MVRYVSGWDSLSAVSCGGFEYRPGRILDYPAKIIKIQGGFQVPSQSLALKPAQSSEALPGWMKVSARQLALAGLCFHARQGLRD